MKAIDETGNRYGRLTVIRSAGSHKGYALWLCRCSCGAETIARGSDLRSGHKRSCGCLEQETRVKNGHKRMPVVHGMTHSRLHRVWVSMKARCMNQSHPHYKDYGARGISVCDEWASDFRVFAEWAFSHGYDENAPRGYCTLDRIDPNGNYCPENCRFADSYVQQNNRRDRSNNVRTYVGRDGIYHIDRRHCGAKLEEDA